jgi:hypothetical protein
LQILPHNPGRCCDVKPLWRWDKNSVKLLLNAWYILLPDRYLAYKNRSSKEKRQTMANKNRPNREVEVMLARRGKNEPRRMTRALRKITAGEENRLRDGRRKGKSKNYRQPPVAKKRVNEPVEEDEESGQEEEPELPPIAVLEDEQEDIDTEEESVSDEYGSEDEDYDDGV